VFYPEALPARDRLVYYATEFPTVEINSTFYHLPRETTVASWARSTPSDFCFAVKVSGYITHRLRLRGCEEPLRAFVRVVGGLGSKLGPLLFQLPPSLRRDPGLLAEFVGLLMESLAPLPNQPRVAFEFRHQSWYQEEVFQLLASQGVALCVHDFRDCEAPFRLTSSFAYVRLHGPQRPYTGSYGTEYLDRLANELRAWAASGQDSYVYFNNDVAGHAVCNARELRRRVDELLSAHG